MSYENLIYEQEGPIALVTINRPAKLNALSRPVLDDLFAAVRALETDEGARVMILTGAGDKAFVAGADIAQMAAMTQAEAEAYARYGQHLTMYMESVPKAIIAAVNGFALGGGCELAMACDFIVASERASFGQPEVNLGIIPGFGGTQRLARQVGRGMARQLIYTGDRIDAAEALRIGLVNAVCAPEALLDEAKKIAGRIASKGPLAVGASKRALNRGADLTLEAGLDFEVTLFASLFKSEDMREGTSAFLERRKAEFKGC